MQNQPRRPQQQRQPQRQLSEEEARQEYWRRQREMYQDPNVRKAELKHRQQMEEAIEDPDGKRYGMGLITTAVVLSLILLVLCAALVALIVMSQPKPKVTTLADLGDSNGFATISDTLDPRGALEPDTNIMPTDIPVLFDKIIITSPITAEVTTGGHLVINQIVGTERIQIAEFFDIRPNVPIELKVMGSLAVQNASYEYRFVEPIVYADGTRGSFHAYLLNYNWERDSYLRAMAPSEHALYVLAPGEEPDMLELIESGIAERTKDDLVRHGDTLVTLEKKEELEREEEAANANGNTNGNANANNGNANQNANDNRNVNENANGNANSNANSNAQANANSNTNNANGNANGNKNQNANANSNQQNHTT